MAVSTSSRTMAGRISLSMCFSYFFRHCERREAMKQSSLSAAARILDCFASLAMTGLSQVQGNDDEVDRLDADEGNDDTAEAVDQQVAPEQCAGPDRAIGDALQRQRDQCDDNKCVEDDRRQDGAL